MKRHFWELVFLLTSSSVFPLVQLHSYAQETTPPVNDNFINSLKLEGTNVTTNAISLGATAEPGEPVDHGSNTIWFSWTAPITGRASYGTSPNYAWETISVFTGSAVDQLTRVRLAWGPIFLAEEGKVYHFQYAGAVDEFALSIVVNPFSPCTNDYFSQAPFCKGQSFGGSSSVLGATVEPGEPDPWPGVPSKSLWWKWQAPVNGRIMLRNYGLIPEVLFTVYQGTNLGNLKLIARRTNEIAFFPKNGDIFYLAVAVPEDAIGDVVFNGYLSLSPNSYSVPGNLLQEGSFEGTWIYGTHYWVLSGQIGGGVNEDGGADGTTWPVLGPGSSITQYLPTVPGENHLIHFAFNGVDAQIQVLWDDREVGIAQIPAADSGYWHWADFTAYASNTTSCVSFVNLGGLYNNVAMDAFSVISLSKPPRVIRQPSSMSVMLGGTLGLQLELGGSEPFSYQWFFNDSPLSFGTNADLFLTRVSTAEAGNYFAVVTNAFGAVTSAPISVAVETQTNATIIVQPSGEIAAPGDYFNFCVVAVGILPLTYQWYFQDSPIPDATNRNLLLSQVQGTNAGQYKVFVQNCAGAVWSLPANLIVSSNIAGGAQVNFANKTSRNEINAPIFDVDQVTPLSSGYVAQLYGGLTPDTMRAAGQPSQFRAGAASGYFYAQGVTLPNVPPESIAFVQVRVWERQWGASYEEARALGGKFGKSEILQIQTVPLSVPPPMLTGLQSFSLQAGLPHFSFGVIEFLERQPGGVILWVLRGEAGFRYLVEKTIRSEGAVWSPYTVVTNVTGTVTFSDAANTASSAVLYRARLLD